MKKKIKELGCVGLCAIIALTAFAACTPENVPEEKDYTDVFIFMGQSNMSGQGRATEAIFCPDGHGYEYRAVSGNDTDGWLYPVAEPFGATERNTAIGDTRSGGLVSSFFEAYYEATGIAAIGVTASISGSAISIWQPGETAYNEAVSRLNSCLDYLEEEQVTIRSVNMVWCQGESDAYRAYYENYDYIGKLTNLFDGMKRDAKVETCFIVTPSIYSSNELRDDKQALADKQAKLCSDNENFVLVSRKFENVPLNLRDDPHFFQGVYNVSGWEAGKNAATYLENGVQPVCEKYAEGEAEELAERFGITLTYNRSAEEQPEQPELPEGAYYLEKKNNPDTKSTPGIWTYTAPAGATFEEAPRYQNGEVIMKITNMIVDNANTYQVRFQPDLPDGTAYTVTFRVQLIGGTYFVFGNEYMRSDYYPANKITQVSDGVWDVTYDSTVAAVSDSKGPFMVDPKGATGSSVTMIVSIVVITAR